MFRRADLFEDLARRLGPDEGLGIGIVVVPPLHGGLEFGLLTNEPESRNRRETQLKAGRFDPPLDGRRPMCGILVNAEMEIEASRRALVDQLEKAQELTMSIVGHGSGTPLLHRQSRLGVVEGLDLALFIDAEDQHLIERIELEPGHVLHLGDEVFFPHRRGPAGSRGFVRPSATEH